MWKNAEIVKPFGLEALVLFHLHDRYPVAKSKESSTQITKNLNEFFNQYKILSSYNPSAMQCPSFTSFS